MAPEPVSGLILPPPLHPARKALLDEHRETGSWHRVADAHRVNVRYVFGFAKTGKIPENKLICKRMGIKKTVTINQLLQRSVNDMPMEILKLAFEHRTEMAA